MSVTDGAVVTVVQPGGGDSVPIPGFGAVFKLTSRTTGESLEAVKHSAAQVITGKSDGHQDGRFGNPLVAGSSAGPRRQVQLGASSSQN